MPDLQVHHMHVLYHFEVPNCNCRFTVQFDADGAKEGGRGCVCVCVGGGGEGSTGHASRKKNFNQSRVT